MKKLIEYWKAKFKLLYARYRFRKAVHKWGVNFNVAACDDFLPLLKTIAQYWIDFYTIGYNVQCEEIQEMRRVDTAQKLINLIDLYLAEQTNEIKKAINRKAIIEYYLNVVALVMWD